MIKRTPEGELCDRAEMSFKAAGFRVSREVLFAGAGGPRIDLLARKGDALVAVEAKTNRWSQSLAAVSQGLGQVMLYRELLQRPAYVRPAESLDYVGTLLRWDPPRTPIQLWPWRSLHIALLIQPERRDYAPLLAACATAGAHLLTAGVDKLEGLTRLIERIESTR